MQSRRTVLAALVGSALPIDKGFAKVRTRSIDPTSASYAQAMEVVEARRLLFISGQVPADEAGKVPDAFVDQARLAWRNVLARLVSANMNLDNIVKVTIFLSDRRYRAENAAVRHEVLGEHAPALTIIITGIYAEEWLLEIEAVAAA